jgi:hypothetical protein
MPPRPSPTSAESYQPVDQPAPRHSLRTIPAGYELEQLPIHVEPQDGESPVSWLRRLSLRYDVPTRDLIRFTGSTRRITGTSKVAARLRNQPGIPARLGLSTEQSKTLLRTQPLAAATKNYIATLQGGTTSVPVRSQSRYCPRCLTGPDPWWPDHWQSPLSLICLQHRSYLLTVCPACGQPPQGSSAWLSHPIDLHRCPSRLPTRGPHGTRRQRPWCDHDLTTADSVPAPEDQVRAQQLLHQWAAGKPADPATACGVEITHRIGFHALAELLDADRGPDAGFLDLATDPATLGPSLSAAMAVLDAPTLDEAADAAGMLSYRGPHAPIAPAARIQQHDYSPLLAAIQLTGVRDQLPPAEQLTFRTGHRVPRYPAVTTPRNRRHLRLPEHRPSLPEPNPAWIPQTLWANTVPAPLWSCRYRALRDSMLAIALAKIGNPRSWAAICADLDLPARHATRVNAMLRHTHRTRTWPTILAAMDGLMTALQGHPPPVDYPARRELGKNTALLTEAIQTARLEHSTLTETPILVRLFWEKLTGGDIAYAPEPIRLELHSPSYAAHRREQSPHTELFLVAYRHLRQVAPVDGPLTWQPEVSA